MEAKLQKEYDSTTKNNLRSFDKKTWGQNPNPKLKITNSPFSGETRSLIPALTLILMSCISSSDAVAEKTNNDYPAGQHGGRSLQ